MKKNRLKTFASDNNSGVSPEIFEAIKSVNVGHQIAYGDDDYSAKAKKTFQDFFESKVDVQFVFNGTGANIVSLQNMCHSFHGVLCSNLSHINVDECGAPEKIAGVKLIPLVHDQGKITPQQILGEVHAIGFEHHVQPKVISITQATELGTVYTFDEIKALSDIAKQYDMFLHIDGARFSNALVKTGMSAHEMFVKTGADILSFGGTKNGLMMGEAIVFAKHADFRFKKYIRKQSSQLFSKMRYIAAQFDYFLSSDMWTKNATNSNNMADYLAQKLTDISGVSIKYRVESNAVFVNIPKAWNQILWDLGFFYYVWDELDNTVRFMCSFDTTTDDVDEFVSEIEKLASSS
ncbi:MAG: aminotransferase class I/II-fold pyridoxal phosphate-dependent enzyme [Candidatus Cloacimonetes bacterium]|nr:aminotransferase class I/II-fold pyridoxal phosphate-dependent enzyme [Candidatus Cloacimonadota bacterium]